MLNHRNFIFCLSLILFSKALFAQAILFSGGTEPLAQKQGAKKGQFKKIIRIPNSDALLVSIHGQLHPQETLRIYDIWGKKTGRLQKDYTGNTQPQFSPFVVTGDDLLITLNSSAPNAKRPGIVISIQAYTMPLITQVKGLKTRFEGGTHPLVLRRIDYLSIPDSEYLQIDIQGALQKEETLRIYEMQGSKQVGAKIFEHTGKFNSPIQKIAKGERIKITLNSRNIEAKRPNVIIKIRDYAANLRLNQQRKQLNDELQHLSHFKTDGLLTLLETEIKQLSELKHTLATQTSLPKNSPLLKSISQAFQQLSLDYQEIATRQQGLLKRGETSLKQLQQSQQQFSHYIQSAQTQQQHLQSYLKKLAKKQQNAKTDRIFQRTESEYKAKHSRYKRLQVEENMWKETQALYQVLEQKLKNYLKTLQDFNFMLKHQSEIYQNHAKILLRDMSLIDTNISSLAQLSKQLEKLLNAWQAIQDTQTRLIAVSL